MGNLCQGIDSDSGLVCIVPFQDLSSQQPPLPTAILSCFAIVKEPCAGEITLQNLARQVNPVPRLYSRGIGALPSGDDAHSSPPSPRTTPVKPWYGVHRWGFLWYGVKELTLRKKQVKNGNRPTVM